MPGRAGAEAAEVRAVTAEGGSEVLQRGPEAVRGRSVRLSLKPLNSDVRHEMAQRAEV